MARLPAAVRRRELAGVPANEPGDRVVRALFWTLVYHLEPQRWDELARAEPIHPGVLEALPRSVDVAVDVGAGSGRLTQHLRERAGRLIAVEPSLPLCGMLARRLSTALPVAAWAQALPLPSRCAQLTTACAALGPDREVLSELERITAPGGVIALVNPEQPEWFESNGWERQTFEPMAAPLHPTWIDDFFGRPDPPRDIVLRRVR